MPHWFLFPRGSAGYLARKSTLTHYSPCVLEAVQMPSETIWSSNHGLPIQNHQPLVAGTYKLALDVDPEVAKMISQHPIPGERLRRLLADEELFTIHKGSLLALTAPMPRLTAQYQLRLQFGTALILGGIALRHPPQELFLQKFSAVAEATRDIELSGGLGSLSLEGQSRRTSFNELKADLTPRGLLNDNLNMPMPRLGRHQLILEKIDHYNSTSPIQSHSEVVPEQKPTFWNPALALSFVPLSYYPPQFGYGPPTGPMSPPPFMMNQGFMDMYGFGYGNPVAPGVPGTVSGNAPDATNIPGAVSGTMDGSLATSSEPAAIVLTEDGVLPDDGQSSPKGHAMGIGLNASRAQLFTPLSYMFHPFAPPYGMYPSPPPMTPPPDDPPAPPAPALPPPQPAPAKKRGKRLNGGKNGPSHIYRLPLLEEVRANPKKDYHLRDIYGHAIEFTKDQHGLRFIQQKLPEALEEEKEVIFNEIREMLYELMTDVFGNYVIQKYFEHGSTTQQLVLLESMTGHIYELSLQMYGCRVVQRALEAIDAARQIKVVDELREYVLICAKDQNGNHVIQKLIERIPCADTKFIVDALRDQIYHLLTHPYGCRVIQRLLEHLAPEDQQMILAELHRYMYYLIQDQYGNYVMQHIIERGDPRDREAILKVVLGQVVAFSKHKFASNVIEKCIKAGDLSARKRILHEVMLGNEDFNVDVVGDDSPLALMMKDQYANYVIQKLVEVFDAKLTEKRILVTKLRQYLKQISLKNAYGKHLASVEKMIIVAETTIVDAANN